MYDIIGDVHGYAATLKKLLKKMGYVKLQGSFRHPSRKVIFVGDIINRGNEIRQTISIVRGMVDAGNAFAVLGNHEVNLITFFLKNELGLPLIKSGNKNFMALYKTIHAFSDNPEELKSHRKWMRTLPFFLEQDGIRVVHACWSEKAIDKIKERIPAGKIRKEVFRNIYLNPTSKLAKSVDITIKGLQFRLPRDIKVVSNKGLAPRSYRLRWWEKPDEKTFNQLSFESKFTLPEYSIPKEIIPLTVPYDKKEPPVFFGHYCRAKGPHVIADNLCCVDGCVANKGLLVAYRWDGEKKLKAENLFML